MSIKVTEDKINEVFQHREEFKEENYIKRDYYENELSRALNRYKYVFIVGESGCGKTWLATHVIKKSARKYKFINLSDIKMKGGFYNFFEGLFSEVLKERTETKDAEMSALIATGSIEASRTYEVINDYFKLFLEENKNKLIILDNFETIINDEKMLDDLSCIITMADDPLMIKNNLRFLVIGATNSILQYFDNMPNYQTIASRVQTISIKGFFDTECHTFVSNKFKKCCFDISNSSELSKYILECTAGMPQSVNEICYCIAITYYDAKIERISINDNIFPNAKEKWIRSRLVAEYSLIYGLYKENISEGNELNHVLYALCSYGKGDFSSGQIFAYIDGNAQKHINGISKTNVKKFLLKISNNDKNRNLLIQKNKDLFEIKSYKTFACLKLVVKLENGQVKLDEYL